MDQTYLHKGRFIGENISLLEGIIDHSGTNNIPGLLFLDFEKVFDTEELPFIWNTLSNFHSFNFGSSVTKSEYRKFCFK